MLNSKTIAKLLSNIRRFSNNNNLFIIPLKTLNQIKHPKTLIDVEFLTIEDIFDGEDVNYVMIILTWHGKIQSCWNTLEIKHQV